jgi:hypothetical protein|tara:strand:+ start:1117 stop:1554 length:438 start_codon:yes stop_codon:yes gene_type:complete
VNLSEIKIMVVEDIEFDETELDKESLRIPQLHNKYLVFLTDEKIMLEKYQQELRVLVRKKWLYYTGKMSEEELTENDWEPFGLNILKSDVDKFLESDTLILRSRAIVRMQEEKINYLDSVVKSINGRQWNIRAAIDWMKFTHGIQ